MTLTVVVSVPDGLVIAADSLASLQQTIIPLPEAVAGKCPKCNEDIKMSDLKLQPINVPSGGSPFAQKLFCLGKRNIGVAVFGVPFLDGRTVESHIREFEKTKVVGEESVEEVVKKLIDFFTEIVKREVKDISQIPKGRVIIGFLVAGYDKEDVKIGRTFLVKIGQEATVQPTHETGYSCTVGGDNRVVSKLWKDDPAIPIAKPLYQAMNLQDAIDYAIFLIRTTVDYQRFAPMVPIVGGDIDVAIITHHSGFKWIQHKEYVGEFTES